MDRPQEAIATPRQLEKQPRETIERIMTTEFDTVNSFDSGVSCDETETNDANLCSVSISLLQRNSQTLKEKNKVLFQSMDQTSKSRERQQNSSKIDSVLPQFNLRKSIEMIGRMFTGVAKTEEEAGAEAFVN